METLSQIMIFVCGALSITALNSNGKMSKYGPVIGLIVQPFYFYSSFINEQWGLFSVSFLYTLAYVYGIYTFWLRNGK
jgi:hypothetical protein